MTDQRLVAGVRERLSRLGGRPTHEQVVDALRAGDVVLGSTALDEMVREVRAELLGAGPLQRFLDDASVTDVLVNSPTEVWVDAGRGLHLTGVTLENHAAVRDLAVRLAAAGGQRSTTRARPSTRGCPTAPGSTPCSPRSAPTAPSSPCASCGASPSRSTSSSTHG